jgi:outer membrane receptor for ferric coprogen and ferric-rhodotorulic acid
VVHLTKNLSAFYNRSRNYSPPSANAIDVWQNVIPPRQGEGFDTGVKVSFFGGRLLGTLDYFKTDYLNEANSTLRSQGAKQTLINNMWEVVDPSKVTPRTDWSGVRNLSTEGYEFQVTFAPTRSWRISANASRNSTVPSEIHPEVVRYLNTYRPEWQAKASLRTANGDTVGGTLADLEDAVALSLAEEGRQALGQRRWAFNVITNYSFPREGKLDGWSLGSAARWRGEPVIGYALDANGQFVNSRQFFGKQQTIVNAWIGHRLKRKALTMDIRFGIDNVLNENEPYLYRAVDDGAGNPAPTVRVKPTERTFTLTTSVKF